MLGICREINCDSQEIAGRLTAIRWEMVREWFGKTAEIGREKGRKRAEKDRPIDSRLKAKR